MQKSRLVITIDDPYLTVDEAAEYLRMHPETLRKLIQKGVFVLNRDYFKPRAVDAVRFKKSALDRFMMDADSDADSLAEELLKDVC